MSFLGWFSWILSHLGSYFPPLQGWQFFFSGLVIFYWISSIVNFTFLVAGYFGYLFLSDKFALWFILGAVNLEIYPANYCFSVFFHGDPQHPLVQGCFCPSTEIIPFQVRHLTPVWLVETVSIHSHMQQFQGFFLFWWFSVQTH